MDEDLVAFLHARLNEEAARAQRAIDGPRTAFVSADEDIEPLLFDEDGAFVLPTRILRDIEAKRQIIEKYVENEDEPWPPFPLYYLALPYADHPDYEQVWRP